MVDIWKATCMQTMNHVVNRAANRDEAMLIVNKSLDRWDELLASLVASNGSMKQLYLFPEFNLQGFPLNENVNEWIEKACLRICLLYTSPSPRDAHESRMPSSA